MLSLWFDKRNDSILFYFIFLYDFIDQVSEFSFLHRAYASANLDLSGLVYVSRVWFILFPVASIPERFRAGL